MEIEKHKRLLKHCILIAKNEPTFLKVPDDFRDTDNAYRSFGMLDPTTSNEFAKIEAQILVRALEMNSVMQEVLLNVLSIELVESGTVKVNHFLSHNPHLRVLRLWVPSQTNELTLQALFDKIHFPALQKLYLRVPPSNCTNQQSYVSLDPLANVIAESNTLSDLIIEKCVLDSTQMDSVLCGLTWNRSIRNVILSETEYFHRNDLLGSNDDKEPSSEALQCPGHPFGEALNIIHLSSQSNYIDVLSHQQTCLTFYGQSIRGKSN
jgi:hypothetical protein